MSKYLIIFSILALSILPALSLAQSDVDTSGAASCAVINTNLRYGSKDSIQNTNAVSILQDFLNSHNYLSSSPTGFFGAMTKQAVVAFQRDNNISAIPQDLLVRKQDKKFRILTVMEQK